MNVILPIAAYRPDIQIDSNILNESESISVLNMLYHRFGKVE